jgi:hypothetical protein
VGLSRIGNHWRLAILYSNLGYNAVIEARYEEAETRSAQARALIPTEHPQVAATVYGNLGLSGLFLGKLDAAAAAFRHQLEICGELALTDLAVEGLARLAAIAAPDDPQRCATLLEAAQALAAISDEPYWGALDRRFYAPAREAAIASAWEDWTRAGAHLTLADAIQSGLTASPGTP